MYKKIILLFSALFMVNAVYAKPNYAMIIDAGKVTQLHLFSYEQNAFLPKIIETFTTQDVTDLSSFKEHPDEAGKSLKKILDEAINQLRLVDIDPSTVAVEIYGTERMGSLTVQQQNAIYASLARFIHHSYDFYIDHMESASGEMIGVYYWLAVNYFAENFKQHSPTLGVIDLNDLATHIVYETSHDNTTKNTIPLIINNQSHIIFSKSFDTLGFERMREDLNKMSLANTCYPTGSPNQGDFNKSTCDTLYQTLLEPLQIPSQLLPLGTTQFITTTDITKIYEFLSADIPDHDAYAARLFYVCSTPWELMKKEYEGEPELQLLNFCSNAILVEQLLYDTLQLNAAELWITDKIEKHKVDWPLGSLLYLLVSSSKNH